jgi:hypothetical protein
VLSETSTLYDEYQVEARPTKTKQILPFIIYAEVPVKFENFPRAKL